MKPLSHPDPDHQMNRRWQPGGVYGRTWLRRKWHHQRRCPREAKGFSLRGSPAGFGRKYVNVKDTIGDVIAVTRWSLYPDSLGIRRFSLFIGCDTVMVMSVAVLQGLCLRGTFIGGKKNPVGWLLVLRDDILFLFLRLDTNQPNNFSLSVFG